MKESGVEPERRADLLVRLSDLIFATQWGSQRGIEALEAALDRYLSLGLVKQAAEVQVRLGRLLGSYPGSLDIPRALAYFRAARPVLEAEPETESTALGSLYVGLAYASVYALRLEPDGPRLLQRAFAIGQRLGDVDLQGQALAIEVIWLV